jgi:hypothetical protein
VLPHPKEIGSAATQNQGKTSVGKALVDLYVTEQTSTAWRLYTSQESLQTFLPPLSDQSLATFEAVAIPKQPA